MRAREADPLDALDRVAGAKQLLEELSTSRPYELTFWPSSVSSLTPARASPSTSARISPGRRETSLPRTDGDDAVGAHRVAAHRDLHPGLEAALAVERQPPCERALLGDPERAARNALTSGAEPLAQVRDGARPERDVHVRVEREEALALRFGVAAADGDHLLRVALLQRAGLRQVRREALVGLLANRAGVEDQHVGLVLLARLSQAELLEHALDPLRVVGVHLAAERGDVVAAHARKPNHARRTVSRRCCR